MVNAGLGIQYDAGGNQTAIGGFASTYDAENKLKASTINNYTTTYFYDGEGRRVKKLLASGEQTLFIYDALGQLAAEYTTGQSAHSGTRYLTVDHLGSIRAVTSQEKTVLARRDYLPFGEEIPPPLGGRTSVWAADAGLLQKFTGKARDPETGLDYSLARYMSAAQGRFTGADPIFGDRNDPQSWNMFAYARNNPLLYTDPDGMSYRICQLDDEGKETNCTTPRNELSDKQFNAFQKDNKGKMAFVGGKIFAINDDGSRTQTGTYKQTDVDLDTPLAQAAAQGVQNSATVTDPRFIAAFYGASALGGIGLNALGVTGASGFQMTTALGGTTENMVLVSRWGRTGLEAGDWVMKGGKNWINYALSGKWQPGMGNQFARFASGAEYYVPQSTIRLPIFKEMGLGAIKALLGQRLFIP